MYIQDKRLYGPYALLFERYCCVSGPQYCRSYWGRSCLYVPNTIWLTAKQKKTSKKIKATHGFLFPLLEERCSFLGLFSLSRLALCSSILSDWHFATSSMNISGLSPSSDSPRTISLSSPSRFLPSGVIWWQINCIVKLYKKIFWLEIWIVEFMLQTSHDDFSRVNLRKKGTKMLYSPKYSPPRKMDYPIQN